jgi:hypothetical protein
MATTLDRPLVRLLPAYAREAVRTSRETVEIARSIRARSEGLAHQTSTELQGSQAALARSRALRRQARSQSRG